MDEERDFVGHHTEHVNNGLQRSPLCKRRDHATTDSLPIILIYVCGSRGGSMTPPLLCFFVKRGSYDSSVSASFLFKCVTAQVVYSGGLFGF